MERKKLSLIIKRSKSGILFEQSCEYDIPTNELYSNSYTGIVVVKMKPLGIIDVTHKTHDINESPRVLDIVVGGGDVQQGKQKDALAVCVRLSAQNMLSDEGKVISAQDDDPVYKEADGLEEVAETTNDTIDELKQKNIVLVVNEDTLQTPEKLWERWISLMRQSNVNIDEDDEDIKSDIKYKISYERKRMRTIARKSVVNGP